jgi:hypothetical protein
MDISDLLKGALQGQPTADMVGGARMAALIQMAQFASHCKPVVQRVHEDKLDDTLAAIHSGGGLVMSVQRDHPHYLITAYLPNKEA